MDDAVEARQRRQRLWNRRAKRYHWMDRDTASIREQAVQALDLDAGETVLDVGCGPASNAAMLAEGVGPDGSVVGVDLSPAMLERARQRIDDDGLSNVDVVYADATRLPVKSTAVDAAVATLALSATPDVSATVAHIARVLRDDGRLAVYEPRLIPSGPLRVLNPVLKRLYRYYAHWNPDVDVAHTIESHFETVDVVTTVAAGSGVIVLASGPLSAQSIDAAYA